MSISQRFKEIAKHYDISVIKLEDEIGVKRSRIQNAIRRDGKISGDIIGATIKRYPEINYQWLMTGEGDMMKATPGSRVRYLRGERSLREFAEITGIEFTALSRIEKDELGISTENQKRLVRTCKINLHWLMTGEGTIHTPADDGTVAEPDTRYTTDTVFNRIRSHARKLFNSILDPDAELYGEMQELLKQVEELEKGKK